MGGAQAQLTDVAEWGLGVSLGNPPAQAVPQSSQRSLGALPHGLSPDGNGGSCRETRFKGG